MRTRTFVDYVRYSYKEKYKENIVSSAADAMSAADFALKQRLLTEYLGDEPPVELIRRVKIRAPLLQFLTYAIRTFEYHEDRGEDFSELARTEFDGAGLESHILDAFPQEDVLQKILQEGDYLGEIDDYEDIDDFITQNIGRDVLINLEVPNSKWAEWGREGYLQDLEESLWDQATDHALGYDAEYFDTELTRELESDLERSVSLDSLDDDSLAALDAGVDLKIEVTDVDLAFIYSKDSWDSDLTAANSLCSFAEAHGAPCTIEFIVKESELTPEVLGDLHNAYVECSLLIDLEDKPRSEIRLEPWIAIRLKSIYILPNGTTRPNLTAVLPRFKGHVVFVGDSHRLRFWGSSLRHKSLFRLDGPLSVCFKGLDPESRVIVDIPPPPGSIEVRIDSDSPTTFYAQPHSSVEVFGGYYVEDYSDIVCYLGTTVRSDRNLPYGLYKTLRFFRALEFDQFIEVFKSPDLPNVEPDAGEPDTAVFLSEQNMEDKTPTLFVFPSSSRYPHHRFLQNLRVPKERAAFANIGPCGRVDKDGRISPSPRTAEISLDTQYQFVGDLRGQVISSAVVYPESSQNSDLSGTVLYKCYISPDAEIPDGAVAVDSYSDIYPNIVLRAPDR